MTRNAILKFLDIGVIITLVIVAISTSLEESEKLTPIYGFLIFVIIFFIVNEQFDSHFEHIQVKSRYLTRVFIIIISLVVLFFNYSLWLV